MIRLYRVLLRLYPRSFRGQWGEPMCAIFAERAADIRVRGLERSSEPQVWLSYRQVPDGGLVGYTPKDLVVRSDLPAGALVPAIRRAVRTADPDQPISNVRTMEEVVSGEASSRRAQPRVLGALAATALLLAGIGIHGLLAFTVSMRSRELGVRLALGANPRGVARMVLREGMLLATLGTVPGVLVALLAGRAMGALLLGIRPWDPPSQPRSGSSWPWRSWARCSRRGAPCGSARSRRWCPTEPRARARSSAFTPSWRGP